jgi:hypothetical protein
MQTLFTALGGNMNLLDPQDLAANRNGEITAAQNQRLNYSLGWGQGCGLLVFLPVVLVMGAGFVTMFLTSDNSSPVLIPLLVMSGFTLLVLTIFVPSFWRVINNALKLKRDRENHAIRQAQGQVAFDKNGYSFQAGERRLTLPSPEDTGGLLPGATYRVFYLEETGFLLSAEEVFPASPAQVRVALRDILAQANNFTLDDLERNRSGEITLAQRMKPLGQVAGGALFGLMSLPFGGLFFLQVFPNVDSGDALPAMVIPALVLGIFALVGGWMFLNGLLDMSVSSIEQAQGPGRKEKRTSGEKNRSTRYYYVIDGKSFQVSRRAYTALLEGIDYRIYYLPRTKKMVSIEPIDVTTDAAQRYNLG